MKVKYHFNHLDWLYLMLLPLEVIRSLEGLGVQVILGERVDLNTAKEVTYNDKNERIIKTTSGRELDAELVVGAQVSEKN